MFDHVQKWGETPFLPLQGEGQDGDGFFYRRIYPIPTPTLPLKGREFAITELKLVPLGCDAF